MFRRLVLCVLFLYQTTSETLNSSDDVNVCSTKTANVRSKLIIKRTWRYSKRSATLDGFFTATVKSISPISPGLIFVQLRAFLLCLFSGEPIFGGPLILGEHFAFQNGLA